MAAMMAMNLHIAVVAAAAEYSARKMPLTAVPMQRLVGAAGKVLLATLQCLPVAYRHRKDGVRTWTAAALP